MEPRASIATLPPDASTTFSTLDRGVQRLEAIDLGAQFAPESPYANALQGERFGAASKHFIEGLNAVFSPTDSTLSFRVRSVTTDALNLTSVRLDQTHEGLPVIGGELLFQFSEAKLRTVVGDYAAALDTVTTQPASTKAQALESAIGAIDGLTDCSQCSAELAILRSSIARSAPPKLVWQVIAPLSQINSWRLQIDASSLALLEKHPLALNASSRPPQ